MASKPKPVRMTLRGEAANVQIPQDIVDPEPDLEKMIEQPAPDIDELISQVGEEEIEPASHPEIPLEALPELVFVDQTGGRFQIQPWHTRGEYRLFPLVGR
jgi:hypothetical protein